MAARDSDGWYGEWANPARKQSLAWEVAQLHMQLAEAQAEAKGLKKQLDVAVEELQAHCDRGVERLPLFDGPIRPAEPTNGEIASAGPGGDQEGNAGQPAGSALSPCEWPEDAVSRFRAKLKADVVDSITEATWGKAGDSVTGYLDDQGNAYICDPETGATLGLDEEEYEIVGVPEVRYAATPPADWQTAPLDDLGLPPAIQSKLEDASITTVGPLESLRADISQGRAKWPKGIGPAKVTAIEDAVISWLSRNRDAAALAAVSTGAP
jgi:hypothetical protein